MSKRSADSDSESEAPPAKRQKAKQPVDRKTYLRTTIAAPPLLPRDQQLACAGSDGFSGLIFSFTLVDLEHYPPEFQDLILARNSPKRSQLPVPIGRGKTLERLRPALLAEIDSCSFVAADHPENKCFCKSLIASFQRAPTWSVQDISTYLLSPSNRWYFADWDQRRKRFKGALNPLSNLLVGGLHAPCGYSTLLGVTVVNNPPLAHLCQTVDAMLERQVPCYHSISQQTAKNLVVTLGQSATEIASAQHHLQQLQALFGRCAELEHFAHLLRLMSACAGDSSSRGALIDLKTAVTACDESLRKSLFPTGQAALELDPAKLALRLKQLKETMLLLRPGCGSLEETLTELVRRATGQFALQAEDAANVAQSSSATKPAAAVAAQPAAPARTVPSFRRVGAPALPSVLPPAAASQTPALSASSSSSSSSSASPSGMRAAGSPVSHEEKLTAPDPASSDSSGVSSSSSSSDRSMRSRSVWSCSSCSFDNDSSTSVCAMCGNTRNSRRRAALY